MSRFFLIGLCCAGLSVATSAQVSVNVELDTAEIRLGEPIQLTLTATYANTVEVFWPNWTDTVHQFYIIQQQEIQTIQDSGSTKNIKQLTITAFDTGYQVLAPLAIPYRTIGNTEMDTLMTEPKLVRVNYVAVDTSEPFKPIKPPHNVPRHWTYWAKIIAIPVGILLLALLVFWLYRRAKSRPALESIEPIQPLLPAHQEALERLEQLRAERLWQNEAPKQYQDRLSIIIRTYVGRRWDIPALEHTTEEIREAFNRIPISRKLVDLLIHVLERADLAKFAKGEALPEEHEDSMAGATTFVKETQEKAEAEVEP